MAVDGDGSGYGDGDGYGDGSGSGYGDGYGDLSEVFAEHPLVAGQNAVVAVWRSDEHGLPSNGGERDCEPARPGLVQEVEGPLRVCTRKALHASTRPQDWRGERWWAVALYEPVQWQGDKCASLKRAVLCELA